MRAVHIVSKTYQDPRFAEPTVNRLRVYEPDPVEAVAMVQATAARFETVELVWTTWASDEEYQTIQALSRS
jgi:hypothetical protein